MRRRLRDIPVAVSERDQVAMRDRVLQPRLESLFGGEGVTPEKCLREIADCCHRLADNDATFLRSSIVEKQGHVYGLRCKIHVLHLVVAAIGDVEFMTELSQHVGACIVQLQARLERYLDYVIF